MAVYVANTAVLTAPVQIEGTLTVPSAVGVDPYTGDYEVTPTTAEQTLYTNTKYMTANVVINPIPSNYGLIGWNGSVLTVS